MKTLVAVDVSKETLQIQTESKGWVVSNDSKGIATLIKEIGKMEEPFVVCEATGGYERLLMQSMHERTVPVCRLNPARVRAFAHSEGIRAKTDPIDAQMILKFAKEKDLAPTMPPTPERQRLGELLDRRSHLSEMHAREKNRLQNSNKGIHSSIRRIIRALEKEENRIEVEIRKLITKYPTMKKQVDVLTQIIGIGEITAWSVLGYLGEIDRIGRNEVVALAGIAPFNRDSGKMKGKRKIIGGRAKVRKCLYMAAQTAALHNPVIKRYFEHLTAKGKPYKCAMVAVMRKLLIHMRSELIILKKEVAL